MPKLLTATLTLTLLILITGCATKSNSSQPATNTNETATLPKIANKPDLPKIASPDNPDSAIQPKITQYINSISAKGFSKQNQGIWMQSGNTLLANHQGTIPLPAASLTKVATSLATLKTFNPDHQFITTISTTGKIENGVLEGDLVIEGGEDPFFVWEEAFAIGNLLNEMGIKQIKGNLIITGKFYMNFDSDPLKSGNLLKQGLNAENWPPAALTQYQTLPPNTPKPQIAIAGLVKVTPTPPTNLKPLIRHYSFPLAELLKKMNQYSNNPMAEMLANSVGGAKAVAQKAATAANFPPTEISLVNGSGLSEENKISPRAVCAMFLAIEQYLQDYNMTISDIFAIVGQDEGILNQRKIPPLAVVKSGSLNAVSALAGALPTQNQGIVWFVTMNGGTNLEGFRNQQEILLQDLIAQWGAVQSLPKELQPNPERQNKTSRNEIVN